MPAPMSGLTRPPALPSRTTSDGSKKSMTSNSPMPTPTSSLSSSSRNILAPPPSILPSSTHAAANNARMMAKSAKQRAIAARRHQEDMFAAAKISQLQLEAAGSELRRLEEEANRAQADVRRKDNDAREEDTVKGSYSHSNQSMVAQHTDLLRDVTEDTIDYIERTFIKTTLIPFNTIGPSSPKETSVTKRLRSKAQSKLAEAEAHHHQEKDPEEVANLTLYRKIKGDQLTQLASTMSSATPAQEYDSTVHRALDVYEDALHHCADVLLPTSSLQILLALKTSMALADLACFPVDALVVAKKALLRSEKFRAATDPELDDEEIEIMQMLRDQVSMLETQIAHDSAQQLSLTSGRAMCDAKLLSADENDSGGGGGGGEFEHFLKGSAKKSGVPDSMTLTLAHRVEKFKRLQQFDNGADFIMLGGLEHSAVIKAALDKIFKTYVRGNAVHAETKSGIHVSIDGKSMSQDEFLLGGPYISWDGFSLFCHDFNITPRRDGKGNRKMNTRAGEAFLLSDNADAKMIFTMTALAQYKILRVKSLKEGEGEWSPGARVIWRDSTRIARLSVNPKAGLNFGEFVDCVCRMGLVGFSYGTWAEMFPTSMEKVQAMFLTQMGLLDPGLLNANLHNHQKSVGLSKIKFEGMGKLTKSATVKDLKSGGLGGNGAARRRSQSTEMGLQRARSSSMLI